MWNAKEPVEWIVYKNLKWVCFSVQLISTTDCRLEHAVHRLFDYATFQKDLMT